MTVQTYAAVLPDGISAQDFLAHALVGGHALAPRFWTNARRRHRDQLVGYQPGRRALCAGGRLDLLDLRGQREAVAAWAAVRYHHWFQLARGTRDAKPLAAFLRRHATAPQQYPRSEAEHDFWSQPRINAMVLHNHTVADPQLWLSPTQVEMFQAGQKAYVQYSMDAALACDKIILPTGEVLAPASDFMADRIAYHQQALAHLRALRGSQRLIAVTRNS
ncbi:hypothetical protein [Cryptosporangium phraense]|uniref:Uncharacterized protein n=1 Tax=Cryptosporangium phraense TaxID=2593070 RepID=A0A545AQ11_9ACTN|nr:hypothetical protein [Cryptosporangium phraense]TQS42825.1 hypothetical protein FL583_22500 [Cryptosporangium phraense]